MIALKTATAQTIPELCGYVEEIMNDIDFVELMQISYQPVVLSFNKIQNQPTMGICAMILCRWAEAMQPIGDSVLDKPNDTGTLKLL